jgi:hypothetical protein
MQAVETMTERILYRLSLDVVVRALAERLLQRFAVTVSDLPASAAHHCRGAEKDAESSTRFGAGRRGETTPFTIPFYRVPLGVALGGSCWGYFTYPRLEASWQCSSR